MGVAAGLLRQIFAFGGDDKGGEMREDLAEVHGRNLRGDRGILLSQAIFV